ncbi:MAG TPA: DEAD/DEAH box helicase [Bacteroidota bacterium]|nr:DEAD/DEAH box helicase [Bacteroidota bacterium]
MPTPIQSLAIRPALEGRDIIGLAQTGTGKTAAFVLPLLHTLSQGQGKTERKRSPRALVLTPTRELAQQIHAAVEAYGRFVELHAIAVYGGVDMHKQLTLIRRGIDVVIATPGRLLDHLQRRSIDLSAIQVLVLDEADRMLDMGFIHDVRTIIAALPADRQTMLFSATMPDEIATLAAEVLRNPETIEVGERRNPVEAIEQHFYTVGQEAKTALLLHALESEQMESVLVFARTKHGADKIARRLDQKGIRTTAIHSNRTQGQRDRALEGFKSGAIRVLVATDIAARGLDVDGISHVVNYDIPHQPEDYIHRIGRTGRAGAGGDAVTFVAREDQQYLQRIERHTGKHVQVKSYPGFVPPAVQPGAHAHPAAREHKGPVVRNATGQPSGSHHRASSHAHTGTHKQPESNLSSGPYGKSPSHPRSGVRIQPGSQRHSGSHGNAAQRGADSQTGSGRHQGSPARKGPYSRPGPMTAVGAQGHHTASGRPGSRPQSGVYGQSGVSRNGTSASYGGRQKKSAASGWQKPYGKKKKRAPMLAVRKKTPPKKLDSFSSNTGGSGWSNY